MRIPIITTCFVALAAAASATNTPKCNTRDNNESRQRAAIKDFANLFLVQKNIQKAFDVYVPGYVHSPINDPPR